MGESQPSRGRATRQGDKNRPANVLVRKMTLTTKNEASTASPRNHRHAPDRSPIPHLFRPRNHSSSRSANDRTQRKDLPTRRSTMLGRHKMPVNASIGGLNECTTARVTASRLKPTSRRRDKDRNEALVEKGWDRYALRRARRTAHPNEK